MSSPSHPTSHGAPYGHDAGMLQALWENSPTAFAVVSPDGGALAVNGAMCGFLGRDEATLLSLTWRELVRPEDVPTGEAFLRQVMADPAGNYTGIVGFLRPDGSVVWGVAVLATLRDEDGSVQAFIALVIDHTAETESAELLQAVAENASDVVFRADSQRRITWISPTVTAVLGWSPEELLGTQFTELMDSEYLAQIASDRDAAYVHGRIPARPGGYVFEVRTKSGDRRWFAGDGRPVVDARGRPDGVVVGLKDVTEVVRRAEEAETARARFAAALEAELDPHVFLSARRDARGEITDLSFDEVNRAAASSLHVEREDLVGRGLIELFPQARDDELLHRLVQVVESGESLHLQAFPTVNRVDGSEALFDVGAVKVGDELSLSWRDVTDLHQTVRRLAESEERHRLLTVNITDMVAHTRAGVLEWVSPSVLRELGGVYEDWVGHELADFVHPDDRPILLADENVVFEQEADIRARLRIRDVGGDFHWVDAHARAYRDIHGEPEGTIATFRIVDDLVEIESELDYRARFDSLTGLMNRREVLGRIHGLTAYARRVGEGTAILFCDVDNLKDINDAHGHVVGDAVLQSLASRIVETVREDDLAARIGGDELLVVLTGVHGLDEAVAVAEKIRIAASQPIELDAAQVRASLSIGVTLAVPGESVDTLVGRADAAMYQGKQGGRDRVVALPAPEDAGSR